MRGEKPASEHVLATLTRENEEHTSEADEETARESARVVLDTSKARCGDAPEKCASSEDGDHACPLTQQCEGYHCTVLARSSLE
jgi:hypothetical protein